MPLSWHLAKFYSLPKRNETKMLCLLIPATILNHLHGVQYEKLESDKHSLLNALVLHLKIEGSLG